MHLSWLSFVGWSRGKRWILLWNGPEKQVHKRKKRMHMQGLSCCKKSWVQRFILLYETVTIRMRKKLHREINFQRNNWLGLEIPDRLYLYFRFRIQVRGLRDSFLLRHRSSCIHQLGLLSLRHSIPGKSFKPASLRSLRLRHPLPLCGTREDFSAWWSVGNGLAEASRRYISVNSEIVEHAQPAIMRVSLVLVEPQRMWTGPSRCQIALLMTSKLMWVASLTNKKSWVYDKWTHLK